VAKWEELRPEVVRSVDTRARRKETSDFGPGSAVSGLSTERNVTKLAREGRPFRRPTSLRWADSSTQRPAVFCRSSAQPSAPDPASRNSR